MNPSGPVLISIRHLTLRYDLPGLCNEILTSASCEIVRGGLNLLTGENGSGKTSYLRCLVGLQQPQANFIALDGDESLISGEDLVRRLKVAYIPQYPHEAIVSDLPVHENLGLRTALFAMRDVATPFAWFGRPKAPTDAENEPFPGFAARIPPVRRENSCLTLSGGETQLLNLAAVVSAGIDLLVMDEPTGKLDRNNRLLFWNAVGHLLAKGKLTVVATTHEGTVFSSEAAKFIRRRLRIEGRRFHLET